MNIVEYADRDLLAMDLARVLAGALKSALLTHESVSFAVPGGTTPQGVFDALCAADLDWPRVHIFPTDERWVPEGHPRSNARMIREHLLVHRAASARFLSFYRPAERPEDALPELEAMLAPEMPISVLLAGMGADMHVASLFAGAEGMDVAMAPDAPVLAVTRPDGEAEARVTLSAPTLNGALSKHLVIFGDEKRAALERAMFLEADEAPVMAILDGTTVHWAP